MSKPAASRLDTIIAKWLTAHRRTEAAGMVDASIVRPVVFNHAGSQQLLRPDPETGKSISE